MARTFRRCKNKRNLTHSLNKNKFYNNFSRHPLIWLKEGMRERFTHDDQNWLISAIDMPTMKKITSSKSRQEARRLLTKFLLADFDDFPCFVKDKKTVNWEKFSIY